MTGPRFACSHTLGMKVAVSIPDDLFADADRLASRFKASHSQFYARALVAFIARHDDDQITGALDHVYQRVHPGLSWIGRMCCWIF